MFFFIYKEFIAQKSCIYDLEWLSGNQLACGGGDQFISVYDINTSMRLGLLKGHSESVKSLSSQPNRCGKVIASGSRDGSILSFDIRCNKYQCSINTEHFVNIDGNTCFVRPVNTLSKVKFCWSRFRQIIVCLITKMKNNYGYFDS